MNAKNDKPAVELNLDAENKELQRKIKLLERDNRMLAVMTRNSEQLRNSFEAEKKLQYLYNDLLLVNCPNMIFVFNEQLWLVFCSRACRPLLTEVAKSDLINMPFERVFSYKVDKSWVQKVFKATSKN